MDVKTDSKASEGDGRRRRSFLPAPKKASALSLAPSQVPFTDESLQSHSSAIPAYSTDAIHSSLFSWKSSLSSGSAREQARAQPDRSHAADRMRTHRHTEGRASGSGLRVGARIKIGGVKPGILRYLGATHFAPGIFCGIELLDADGNHDGEVNGHRYFICAPNHGIFAPEEKVFLDTSGVSGRLASESDAWYSSSESLFERAHGTSRSYEKGQLETMDRSKLAQAFGSHIIKYSGDVAYLRYTRDTESPAHANMPSSYSLGPRKMSESLEAHSFTDASNRATKSGLPKASKSGMETAYTQSKLHSLPYTYSKCSDDSFFYQRSPSCSSQSEISLDSSLEAIYKNQSSTPDIDSDQEHEKSSHRVARRHRSSDGSRKDGAMRDTLSTGVKEQLRSDSKQYLNFTFDQEGLNRSADSEDIECDNIFKDNDFSLASNISNILNSKNSGPHFENDTVLDILSDNVLDILSHDSHAYHLSSLSVSACSERRDVASPALSRSGADHRLDVKSAGSARDKDDLSASTTCSVCNRDLSKKNLSAGCHICDGGRISKGGYVVRRKGGGGTGGGGTGGGGTVGGGNLSPTAESNESESATVCNHNNRISSHNDRSSQFDPGVCSASRKCRANVDTLSKEDNEPPQQPKRDYPGQQKGDHLHASSARASPEMSLALEWDYGQESDGELALGDQDSTLTASSSSTTSESLSDALKDVSEPGFCEDDLLSLGMENNDQYKTFNNGYEKMDDPVFANRCENLPARSAVSVQNASVLQHEPRRLEDNICGVSSKQDTSISTGSGVVTKRAVTDEGSRRRLIATGHVEMGHNMKDKEIKALFKRDKSLPATSTSKNDTDADTQDEEHRLDGQSAAGAILCQAVPKTNDNDDESADPTGNTEDERIEADQLCGADSKTSSGVAVGEALNVQSSNKAGVDNEGDINQSDQPGDTEKCLASPGSNGKEDSHRGGTSPSKDESPSKSKTRKPITITKKRSENVDHKMPNTNVTSKLADYIKAPVPVKTKEEKEEKENESKKKSNKSKNTANQNRANIIDVSQSMLNLAISRALSIDAGEGSHRNRVERPEAPKPVIKRTPRKNKWDNIMSQIEANKDTSKPKPISEIKSSLAAYLHAPPPQDADNSTDQTPRHQRKEFKSKMKELPPPPPKIDYSKIKSKLNVPTAASAIKAMPKREPAAKVRKVNNNSRTSKETSLPASSEAEALEAAGQDRRMSEGSIDLAMNPITEGDSSAKNSHADLSVGDNTEQPQATQEAAIFHVQRQENLEGIRYQQFWAKAATSTLECGSVFGDNSCEFLSLNHKHDLSGPLCCLELPDVTILILDGVSSKGSPANLSQKENRRSSSLNDKSDNGIKIISANPNTIHFEKSASIGQLGKAAENQRIATHIPALSNQSEKEQDSSTCQVSTTIDSSFHKHSKASCSDAQQELELLESLCEARTQQILQSKMQLDIASQAFDAMTAILNYCSNELKAFECHALVEKLDAAQKQLDNYISQIAIISSQKELLDKNLYETIQDKDEASLRTRASLDSAEKEADEHVRLTSDLSNTHIAALATQKEELSNKHDDNITSLTHFYERQIELLRQSHERQLADITNEGKLEINSLKISHLEEVQGLRNKHEFQMEDLHQQHRNKMEDMTQRFESIKMSLSEKVESLRKECEDLAQRARNSEEALQKDADVKVQMALMPYLSLPSEIDSLKSIQEMRLEEIQKLRMKIVDLEKQLEEMPIATEKIISQQQKIENLVAIINIKTEREKQLHEKCQVLMRKYDRESRANKRISMDFEQVMWRMTQSSDFGSCESLTKQQNSRSPSHSGVHSDVVLRVRKRSSNSINESDRKLRSKSTSFLIERNEGSDSPSPSLSPQLKQKRRSKKCQNNEISIERMFHSAGPDIMSHLLCDPSHQQKEWSKQNENTDLQDLIGSQETSTSNMASLYARSLSGISDSGVYDSMTRSDQLNTSVASTDSEWGTSTHVLVTSDSTMGDHGSGPAAGDYHLLSNVADTDVQQHSTM